jgi:hypothetical protein
MPACPNVLLGPRRVRVYPGVTQCFPPPVENVTCATKQPADVADEDEETAARALRADE